jgi:glycosyltransferase involved in cell wall biosynthesis
MRTCVVIPTYNEAEAIPELVAQIRKQGLEVVVVDDGSADNTEGAARNNGAVVLRNEQNQGKGASLIKGFDYALSKDFDAVITMDGDGQHLPEDIPYFIRLAQYSNSGVFIGNRMSSLKSMPGLRILTNKFMSWLISKVTRQKIPDTQCGFRLIKKEVLKKVKLGTSKFETESEVLIRAARLGLKIESVPIKTVYQQEKSRINPVIDTIRFIRFIWKEIWTTRP